MKFHELHVSQGFIDVYRNRYVKTGHSTARLMRNDDEVHFTQIAEVDGLQSTIKHPVPVPDSDLLWPIPDSDHVGAMEILESAITYLARQVRPYYGIPEETKRLYRRSVARAIDILDTAFDTLEAEHKEATQGDGVR